jgi:DNA-binding beta-propeller fold protein YncE
LYSPTGDNAVRTPCLQLFRPLLTVVAAAVVLTACDGGSSSVDTTSPVANASLAGRFAADVEAGFSEIIAYHAASQSVFITADTVDTANHRSSFRRVSLRSLGDVALTNATTDTNLEGGVFTDVAANLAADSTNPFTAGGVQSIAVTGNLLAIAVQAQNKTDNGVIAFYELDTTGNATYLKNVAVGSLPDGIAFTPDGSKLVIANEGELSKDYKSNGVDPLGSISVIAITNGAPTDIATTLDFTAFDANGARASELPATVRIGVTNNTFSKDAEPEYVSISADSQTAFVTLQENNAVAIVDLSSATPSIRKIVALGVKDYSMEKNALAPSDKVDAPYTLQTFNHLKGLYLPDGIANYTFGGVTYFLTANEGDDRDDFLASEETSRVKDLTLDPDAFPNAAELQVDGVLGRLTVFNTMGDTDGDGDFDELYVLGGRSFSIYNASTGEQVYDSGSIIETQVYTKYDATLLAASQVKGRLDNKGPEPENIVVGQVDDATYAFVGLERASAVAMFNITDPAKVSFVRLFNNTATLKDGDISPEGLQFIPASQSHTGKAMLLVGHEVSGSLAVYTIE